MGRRVALLAALVVLLSAGSASAATPQQLTLPMSDGVQLSCSLTLPDGPTPAGGLPGVMLFHGLGGQHQDMEPIATQFLAPAGYASLARLRALEPDVIKVDRSLLAAENDPDGPTPLLVGIIDLAHRLGATVVAEGVETPVQLAAALSAGCDAVQGFLWGMPGTAEECRALVERLPILDTD